MYDGFMVSSGGAVLADRINHMLALRDMTPAQLARDSGLTPGAISKVLSGKSPNVRSDSVARIAAALEVSADYLQGTSDNPYLDASAPLPEYALELIENMRQLGSAQNYQLLLLARVLLDEADIIRHLSIVELVQAAAEEFGEGAELERLEDELQLLEARRSARRGIRRISDDGKQPTQQ